MECLYNDPPQYDRSSKEQDQGSAHHLAFPWPPGNPLTPIVFALVSSLALGDIY